MTDFFRRLVFTDSVPRDRGRFGKPVSPAAGEAATAA
jgi:hypothetical protein